VTEKNSFQNAKVCFEQIKVNCQPENRNMYAIGNKIDLKDERQVTTEEAMEYWNEVNVEFS
jgi:GTPase SAR1 family protein